MRRGQRRRWNRGIEGGGGGERERVGRGDRMRDEPTLKVVNSEICKGGGRRVTRRRLEQHGRGEGSCGSDGEGGRLGAGSAGEETGVTGSGGPSLLTGRSGGSLGGSGGGSTVEERELRRQRRTRAEEAGEPTRVGRGEDGRLWLHGPARRPGVSPRDVLFR
uniref:Fibroin-like n=1 Tax=Oryza sativa subsp. japonica TaxID=39947 RepID=Q6K9S0_ORYSJ|nr:fibroin-like [Oryza sativa Japonica Group]BAD22958.1 fibroin-like [Oryza sativa Japonica Group]